MCFKSKQSKRSHQKLSDKTGKKKGFWDEHAFSLMW